jgi:hypothetical protein
MYCARSRSRASSIMTQGADMGVLLIVSAAIAQDNSADGPVGEHERYVTWAEATAVTIIGTISDVRETYGITYWDVSVKQQIGGRSLPTVLSVVQPHGCMPDGTCRTSFGGLINTNLTAGTDVAISFATEPKQTPNVALHGANLYFTHDGTTVHGKTPVRGYDCDTGPIELDLDVQHALTVRAREAGLQSVYLLTEAREGMLPWSDFLRAIRACATP